MKNHSSQRHSGHRAEGGTSPRKARPAVAYRQRGVDRGRQSNQFYAQEVWHEPVCGDSIRMVQQAPGDGYLHPVSLDEIRQRVALLPERFSRQIDTIQLSRMTRKRALFPCYGMQWGSNVYLYPIETSLVETYVRPPRPQQLIEARMFGGIWRQDGSLWRLEWTAVALRDFYLNNVLIHEIGHVVDSRNVNFEARERFADWFAVEYGYRASRGHITV